MEVNNNKCIIEIPKSLIQGLNGISIVFTDDKQATQPSKEVSNFNNKRVYKCGFATAFYQYKLGHFDFHKHDKEAQELANISDKTSMFLEVYDTAQHIIKLESKVPWSVFFGIACVCVDYGKKEDVKNGIRQIRKTLSSMKNNLLGLRDFEEGNPVHELCRFIVKTEWKHPSSMKSRCFIAKVATVFWNAYLEGSNLEGFSRKVYNEGFAKLNCIENKEKIKENI